jgi:hypothetical protein
MVPRPLIRAGYLRSKRRRYFLKKVSGGARDLSRCAAAVLKAFHAILDCTLSELWIWGRLFGDGKEGVLGTLYDLLIEFL